MWMPWSMAKPVILPRLWSECAPMGALNPDQEPKAASVGKAFPTCDAKIVDPDEDVMLTHPSDAS